MPSPVKKWCQRIVATILALIFYSYSFCQESSLMVPEMETASGLASNTIRSLKLDSNSKLWIGTDNGITVLNHVDSITQIISKKIGRKSVWAINFISGHALIGTRFDGLYVFELTSGKLSIHYPREKIKEIRKIKILNNRAFILTNKGCFEWTLGGLHILPLLPESGNAFIIDLFCRTDSVFGLEYPSKQIRFLETNKFIELSPFPHYLNSQMGHLFSSHSDKGEVLLGGSSETESLLWHVNQKMNVKELKSGEDLGNATIVWQVEKFDSLVLAGLGNTNTNESGAFYISTVGTNKMVSGIQDYVTCFEVDSRSRMVYVGTLNNGLYLKHITEPGIRKSAIVSIARRNGKDAESEFWIGDTLISIYADSVIVRNLNLGKTIASFENHPEMVIHIARAIIQRNYLYLFDSYGEVYAYNFNTKNFKMAGVKSTFPYVQIYENKILLLNRERGFNLITEDTAFELKSNNTEIGFATDFAYSGNKLFTLSKNSITLFDVDWKNNELTVALEYIINDQVIGFAPKWVEIHNGQIVLMNNNGLLFLDMQTGEPTDYFYLGRYNEIEKPTFSGDDLVIRGHNIEERIRLKPGIQVRNHDYVLQYPETINEKADFTIKLKSSAYLIQNHHLKKIQIWKGEKLFLTKYILDDNFTFYEGFPSGSYKAMVSAGGAKTKFTLKVTIPLNRNPIFFAVMALVVLALSGLVWKLFLDRKRLQQKTLENKILVLNQNLNPHFVYNSMNLITSLILEEKYKEAVEVVSEFSRLQRTFLETNQAESISLSKELMIVRSYLDMQKKRFRYDHDFDYSIDLPPHLDLENIMVPPFILQPLVENAVKHGVLASEESGKWIKIAVVKETGVLIIKIEDNGTNKAVKIEGTGLGHRLITERINVFNQSNRKKIMFLPNSGKLKSEGYSVTLRILT